MLGIDSVKSGINSEKLAMTSRTVSRHLTVVLDVERPEARGESGSVPWRIGYHRYRKADRGDRDSDATGARVAIRLIPVGPPAAADTS